MELMKPSIKKRKIGLTYGYNLSSYQCTVYNGSNHITCTNITILLKIVLYSLIKLFEKGDK